jgi:hypothetical protein
MTSARLVTAALAIALLGSACGLPLADREEADGPGERRSVFSLRVGDCYNSTGGTGDVWVVDVVPCSAPHTYEVYFLIDHPAGANEAYPGDGPVTAFADRECGDRFASFVGIEYQASALYIDFLYPGPDTWRAGDREVVCTVYDPGDAALVGSMRNSGR